MKDVDIIIDGIDGITRAYENGYEQGRYDALSEYPNGIERGYEVVPVIRCINCKHFNDDYNENGFPICTVSGMDRTDYDYCSFGELREVTL